MGAREDCARLVKQGVKPLDIGRRRSISVKTVFGYLDEMIGRGDLRRSDVAFTVPAQTRKAIAALTAAGHSQTAPRIHHTLKGHDPNVEIADIDTVIRYGATSGVLGEMYEDLRAIEVGLHRAVRTALEDEYGRGEMGWWRKAVPEHIRSSCQTKREQDSDPVSDAYHYTDLMELRDVLTKNWEVVSRTLPSDIAADRKQLGSDLARLNGVRRNVMHPVRAAIPSEEEFQFVRALRRRLGHVASAER